MGGDEVAVDEVFLPDGFCGDGDEQLVEVGGDGFGFASLPFGERVAARQDNHEDIKRQVRKGLEQFFAKRVNGEFMK